MNGFPLAIGRAASVASICCSLLCGCSGSARKTKARTEQAGVDSGIVNLADANIQYFTRGKGETVVLLPGGTLAVGYLDDLANDLAAAGYRVVGINFRGAGASTGSGGDATLHTMGDDVAGVIVGLHLAPANVIGSDFGNRVARVVAGDHPTLVNSVILLAAGGKFPPTGAAAKALQVLFSPSSTKLEQLSAMRYMVANPVDIPKVVATIKAYRAPGAAEIEQTAANSTPLASWWAPPGQTKYLILQGDDDQIAPPENGQDLAKELGPRATVVGLPNVGHLSALEAPEQVARHIIDFLKATR
jgi:pimeloyl-ACP methyl ester carboxylesterase